MTKVMKTMDGNQAAALAICKTLNKLRVGSIIPLIITVPQMRHMLSSPWALSVRRLRRRLTEMQY